MHIRRILLATAIALLVVSPSYARTTVRAAVSGAVYTTTKDGTAVNQNTYGSTQDVYISRGPHNKNAAGFTQRTYYFPATHPPRRPLLPPPNAVCRLPNRL